MLNLKGTSNNFQFVTPAQAGVQLFQRLVDSCFRRNDIFSGNLKPIFIVIFVGMLVIPKTLISEEINGEGWPVPDLKGLVPYSIVINKVDGVEKVIEKFYISAGGHVARISGNGKVFAYAVDRDQKPPIDYLLLDPDGSGKFIKKLGPAEVYSIPEWISY